MNWNPQEEEEEVEEAEEEAGEEDDEEEGQQAEEEEEEGSHQRCSPKVRRAGVPIEGGHGRALLREPMSLTPVRLAPFRSCARHP